MLPLFSHCCEEEDTKSLPISIFTESPETMKLQKEFYSNLQEISSSADLGVVLSTLPQLEHQLRELMTFDSNRLYLENLTEGCRRIVEHFLVTHEVVQSRGNAFMRSQVAIVNTLLTGQAESQADQSDRLLLQDPDMKSETMRRIDDRRGIRSPLYSTKLFAQVDFEAIRSHPWCSSSIASRAPFLELEESTQTCLNRFIASRSTPPGTDRIEREQLNEDDQERLGELFVFFGDPASAGNTVTLASFQLGLSTMACHFIARDDLSQRLANSYCREVLRSANNLVLEELSGTDKSSGSRPNSSSNSNNNNTANWMERSSSSGKSDGSDKSAPRIATRPLSPAPSSQRPVAQTPAKPRSNQLEHLMEIDENVDGGEINSEGFVTNESSEQRMLHQTYAKMGKSRCDEILQAEGIETGDVLQRLEAVAIATPLESECDITDEMLPVASVQVLHRHNNSINKFDNDQNNLGDGCSDMNRLEQRPESDDRDFKSDHGTIDEEGIPDWQQFLPTNGITEEEIDVLQLLQSKLGSHFHVPDSLFPAPVNDLEFNLWLSVNKKRITFDFHQADYGVMYHGMLSSEFVGDEAAGRVRSYHCFHECNRCFFLHLGIATNIHPFALQAVFRLAAEDILSRPEETAAIFFGECLQAIPEHESAQPGLLNRSGVFVDALSLMAIWPKEMDEYRILVCKLNYAGSLEHYTLFEPRFGPRDENGQWVGKDVIMTNQFGHFALLNPVDSTEKFPITRLLATAQATAREFHSTEPLIYLVELPEICGEDRNSPRRYRMSQVSEILQGHRVQPEN